MRPGAEYGSLARALKSPSQHYLEGFLTGAGRRQHAASTAGHPVPADRPASQAGLSWEERVKRDLFPGDAFPRLWACAQGDEPPSDADRFRFRWFGLFYQGPEKDAFTARLRLPGGRLQGFQWLELARIVQELAGGYVECNPQGGLDLPGIPVRASVELLRRVEGAGLSARGTGGDCVQAVRGGERADLPMVRVLEHALAHGREFGDLPGPCVVAFCPTPETPDAESIIFQALAGAEEWSSPRKPDPPAWRLILPGTGDLGIAVAAAETVPVCLALLRAWSRQANRETRERATLANYCRELGVAGLRDAVARELGRSLVLSSPSGFSIGPQSGGPGEVEVEGGRLLSGQMEAISQLAAEHGGVEVRVVAPGSLLVAGNAGTAAFEAQLRRIVMP